LNRALNFENYCFCLCVRALMSAVLRQQGLPMWAVVGATRAKEVVSLMYPPPHMACMHPPPHMTRSCVSRLVSLSLCLSCLFVSLSLSFSLPITHCARAHTHTQRERERERERERDTQCVHTQTHTHTHTHRHTHTHTHTHTQICRIARRPTCAYMSVKSGSC